MPRPDVYLHVDNTDFFQRMAGILVAFARELEQHPAQVDVYKRQLSECVDIKSKFKTCDAANPNSPVRSCPIPFCSLSLIQSLK